MSLAMTKRLEFDAGHRLMNHESKCANVHGHRYAVEVTLLLTGTLDRAGRIVDFGDVKRGLGAWLDTYLDHACIVNAEDRALVDFLVAHKQKHYVFRGEPSAENLADHLLMVAAKLLDVDGARRVTRVVLFETPTSSAEASR
jgi:6-pyruvoyltetrahydropterin/6-carboxytetrahydropterin synthase